MTQEPFKAKQKAIGGCSVKQCRSEDTTLSSLCHQGELQMNNAGMQNLHTLITALSTTANWLLGWWTRGMERQRNSTFLPNYLSRFSWNEIERLRRTIKVSHVRNSLRSKSGSRTWRTAAATIMWGCDWFQKPHRRDLRNSVKEVLNLTLGREPIK